MLERTIQVFRPHHLELRKRIIKIFLSIILCSAIAYYFSQEIASFFIEPLYEATPLMKKLVYTNLPEAFIAYIKLSILVGLAASFPVILYQLWSFVAPGLKKGEKKVAVTVVFWGSLLFILGGFFAAFGVLPQMLKYFMSYADTNLEPLPRFGKYLTFVIRTIIAFGLAFQIPFLMVMTGRANLVSPIYFRSKRLYFYGAIVVLAFLLSAGDLMATVLISIPLFLLYESGILLMRLFPGKAE
ncbi:MAG: twin-arginine translocase subunit TatC [Desulfopila sp.]|jgi:sec-independent protein translocase protein TatC|nr:twin-arginine translocase subunit TatC [Desulfopila sp.]